MPTSRKFYAQLPGDSAIEEEFNLPPGFVYKLASDYVLEHWTWKGVKIPRSFPTTDLYSYARYCAVEELICRTYTGSAWTHDVRQAKSRRLRRWAI